MKSLFRYFWARLLRQEMYDSPGKTKYKFYDRNNRSFVWFATESEAKAHAKELSEHFNREIKYKPRPLEPLNVVLKREKRISKRIESLANEN